MLFLQFPFPLLGPKKEHFADCATPGDYFLTFLDNDLVNDILFQTNLYANQRQHNIPAIKKEELYGFLGMNLMMGYHHLPSLRSYWSGDEDLSVPVISSTMSRNRFYQILSNLHVNDNDQVPADNKDKLYKLRPMINKLNANFMKLYNVSERVSIDESMILFKGRSSLKQYNPMKPIKRGYKLWERADADGYISKFEIYQGKNGPMSEDPNMMGFGLGEKVVIGMANDLVGKNHQLCFDNYFSSVALMDYLKENGVRAYGTIRSTRKDLPDGLKADKKMERGDFDHRSTNDGIVFYKWKDNKVVHFVSNFHGTETTTIRRTQKDGSRKDVTCPKIVKDYNQDMGGVDKADMLCAVHGVSRKSKKWWHRIFFGLLDRCLVNAAVVYDKIAKKGTSIFEFRRGVAMSLITLSRQPTLGRPRSSPSPVAAAANKRRRTEYSVTPAVRLSNRGCHWIHFTEKRGRCEVCSKNKIESRPKSKCSMCKVFLCCNDKKNCFIEYHEIKE